MDRLLLETDSPDGLPHISDAELARKVEAAAGCSLRIVALPYSSSADGNGGHSLAAHSQRAEISSGSGSGSAASPAGSQAASATGRHQNSSDSTALAAAPTLAPAAAASTADGSRTGGVATAPLDWRCPLDVKTADGGGVRVEHPRQLLNQPANVRCTQI